jgi:hypothetical protein
MKFLHLNMQFLMSTCDFFPNIQFFSEHACSWIKSMFGKKSHVDIKNCMLTCDVLHVDIQKFHVNMQFFSQHACSEKNCMSSLTCKNFMSTCIFARTCIFGKNLHVNIDNIDIHVQISSACWHAFSCMWTYKQQLATWIVSDDQRDAVRCGEKFYSMATWQQSSAGLVSNRCLSWRFSSPFASLA